MHQLHKTSNLAKDLSKIPNLHPSLKSELVTIGKSYGKALGTYAIKNAFSSAGSGTVGVAYSSLKKLFI